MYDIQREQLERGNGITVESAAEIEELTSEHTAAMDDVFKEVYDAAHSEGQPDQRVQTGLIVGTVVRDAAPNCEQELAVRVDILLPDAETVKSYKALYGSRHPDDVIDRLFDLYVPDRDEGRLTALMGVEVPLAYVDGGWQLYLVPNGGVLGRLRRWAVNNRHIEPDSERVVSFGKSYQTPFPEGDVIESRELLEA